MEQILTKRRYFDIGLQIEELLYSGYLKLASDFRRRENSASVFKPAAMTIREAIIMLELKEW